MVSRHIIVLLSIIDPFYFTALATSNNIAMSDEITVDFLFGPNVFVPNDNLLIDNEQCFEIGLDCTVLDLPSLVHGSNITFEAYVITDGNTQTPMEIISFLVSCF